MAKVTIPLAAGEDGPTKIAAVPPKVQEALQALKAESAYFVQEQGSFDCFIVFDLDFATLIRPLFPGLDASFHVTPVMSAVEFQALGDPRGRGQPTAAKAEDLVAALSPEAKKPPERLKPLEAESPYVETQRERELRAKKLLEKD